MLRSLAPALLLCLCGVVHRGEARESMPTNGARQAVEAGLALVQKAAENYPTHRQCFSCHHQTLPLLAIRAAQAHGVAASATLLAEQAQFTLDSFEEKRDDMRKGKGVGGGAITVGYGLWALDLGGCAPDETTEAMIRFLLKTQNARGHWTTGNRPPMEESAITTTALAIRGLARFAPPELQAECREAIDRARKWVVDAPIKVHEDRLSKLWVASEFGKHAVPDAPPVNEILNAQRDDGGWACAEGLESDAYATGQTLARLEEAGLSSSHPAIQRGVAYLLKTRHDDGSWKVVTRSRPVQVYFDNGDPHGKDQFISTPATAWAVIALTGVLTANASTREEPYDLVIRGGKIVDGTGNPWFFGDLAIRGDRIAAVGTLPADIPANRVIDARNRVVAPGFIDMHSHSDMPLLEDGAAMSKITQGVTTDILGEDTSGGPSRGRREPRTFKKGEQTLRWSTLGGYFDALEKSGMAINVASYVGLGTLLGCVQGDSLERPSAAQLDELRSLLDEAMADGALGLSTMLASPRELNVTTDDLVALGQVVHDRGGIYSSHIRNEGTEVFQAVDEAIAIGERARVPVDIIHIKIADQTYWRRMDEIIARVNDARRRGVNVQANIYPYTRGNNDLVSIIPPWAHEGGTSAMIERINDPSQRARIKHDILNGLPGWYNHYTAVGGDWSRMLVSARLSAKNAAFQGQTMDAILEARLKRPNAPADPLDRFLDFLVEERGSVSTIYAHHTEADMNLAMRQPWCSIGSDGSALATEGTLRRGHPHPRNFGTFPRVLGVYVRQRHLLTLEDAIRKMTSLNAAKVGLRDRGLLRPGLFADVTVFDPETVVDHSTFLEPFHYSQGIEYVVVNGRVVLSEGKPTAERPGRALRHGR